MEERRQSGRPPGGLQTRADDIATFLGHYRPFKSLSRRELETVAASIQVMEVRAGAAVLVEDGLPGTHLYVVHDGAMELVYKENVVEVFAPGEVFGHPTLITGMPPAFTVRAREDSGLFVIPRDVALEVLGRPSGLEFVAETLCDRLRRAVRSTRAATEARTVPVASLIRREPVFCDSETSIREVSRIMSDENVTAVLVPVGRDLGIVTNADLRDKVLAGDISADAPVRWITSTPVKTIRADRLAPEASIEMMSGGFNHIAVVDANDHVLGIVSAGSLMTLDALSPFALRWSIATARDEDAVAAAFTQLPAVFVALLEAHLDAPAISRVLTLQSDVATSRLIELAIDRHGPPPAPFAWLALGSVARSEATLTSDQDNALAYEDPADPTADGYFERLAVDVNAGLARCGFALDVSDVMARNRSWRMSASEWAQVFAETLEMPDRSHLVRAALSFDFRQVTGELSVTPDLLELLRDAPRHLGFVARLARTATDIRSPLGFRQRLIGPIDVKKSALLPIENLARFHALANGITAVGTLDRLVAVEEAGVLDPATATALREAFTRVSRVRLEHHAAAIKEGRRLDNAIDSNDLPPLARVDLQSALRAIVPAQKQLSRYVPLGM